MSDVETRKTTLIPQPFWFRPLFQAPKVERIPRVSPTGRLLDLAEACLLPNFGELDGHAGWSRVWVAWNDRGLALSVEVTGKSGRIQFDSSRPQGSDGINVWVDTRDTRDIHRASRYCHKISAMLFPRRPGEGPDVMIVPEKIARAQADAPLPDPDSYQSRAALTKQGWRLELFIPARNLQGFDPETNRRLGFNVQVIDPERGDEFLTGLGREFPQGEDPSLWSSLELGA